MKMKLIGEILRGIGFHYYDNPDRVYIKEDPGHAIAPSGNRVKISDKTLVVPHDETRKGEQHEEK